MERYTAVHHDICSHGNMKHFFVLYCQALKRQYLGRKSPQFPCQTDKSANVQ